jgi:hypothetical protein
MASNSLRYSNLIMILQSGYAERSPFFSSSCFRSKAKVLRPGVVLFNRKLYFDCPSSHIHAIKGSVQRKLRPIVRYWPGNVALGNIFFLIVSILLVLKITPFPVSLAKFQGDFWINRCIAVNNFQRFAHSFMYIMYCAPALLALRFLFCLQAKYGE